MIKSEEKFSKIQTSVRIPEQIKEELMREAQVLGLSFNSYILMLIRKARQCQP